MKTFEYAYVIVWDYRVKPEHLTEFVTTYGSDGDWARLFSQADGFVGTELWQDAKDAHKRRTVDVWESKGHFERFKETFARDYVALDERTSSWTTDERMRSATSGAYVLFEDDEKD